MSSLEQIDLDSIIADFEKTFFIEDDEYEEPDTYPASPHQITIRNKKRKITFFIERED